MEIVKSKFGEFEGQQVDQFEMKNKNGMTVKIMNYGATITSITVPVSGKPMEVACGFNRLEDYISKDYIDNAPYFGCTVGRYSSQIKDARFTMDGQDFKLAANAGKNNLHGGEKGFDKRLWKATQREDGVSMRLESANLEEGFPGYVSVEVSFSLTEQNELVISYQASADQKTPLSLTNHTYFNLSGFHENIENHSAKINTDKLLELDDSGAATGKVLKVGNTHEDLRDGKRIGEVHQQMGDGFEHFYVFDNPESALKHLATVKSGSTPLSLEVHSTEPCMLFYTGKYTSDKLSREEGIRFGKYRAFCCETHRYPNGPNIKNSPGTFTVADTPFTSQTVFRFKEN